MTDGTHRIPEIWAGAEYTHNRVGDEYYDQMERSGHFHRFEDMDRLASLGVRKVRFPILWELVAPNGLDSADWSWTDARLERLRQLNVEPVASLLHHGSGPPHTSLCDPDFPQKFAAYAHAVARRYPWLDLYTPVNEPLTTARFSGLYGFWYPHGRDEHTWLKALSNQVKAIVMAMRAVKSVNPGARLMATDDLGKTHSTPRLEYQAALENERRWLSFDLLLGRVTPRHPLWPYVASGLGGEEELTWHLENRVGIDLLGLNHYLSSERYLDERLENFPEHTHGGNGKDAYADVEANRVLPIGQFGPRLLFEEAWARYRIPIAMSEVHNGSTEREEQLRWMMEMWRAALSLNRDESRIKAFCSWAAFGSFDWDQMVTRRTNHYEVGAFDVRSGFPRETSIAALIRALAEGKVPGDVSLTKPGWWARPDRLVYGVAVAA